MSGFGITPGFTSSGGASGTVLGPYNKIEYWCSPKPNPSSSHATGAWTNGWDEFYDGVYTWTKPSNIKADLPLRVWVYGPGGNSGTYASSGNSYGGGAGGMAYKEIAIASLGATETITVGRAQKDTRDSRGTTSSFGSHCSATAGNDGYNSSNPTGNPNSTGESSNPQASIQSGYAQGGIGVGGDINRRGGQGGQGSNDPGSGYGGGGGGAPGPHGHKDGGNGGRGTSYCGGSGGSINFHGIRPHTTFTPPGGSGTAGQGNGPYDGGERRVRGGNGGAGLFGAGGVGGAGNWWDNNDQMRPSGNNGKSGEGGAIWDPNMIFLGGGGGGGVNSTRGSSSCWTMNGGCGGPGAGGGAVGAYNSSNDTRGAMGGNGGVLGGAGGSGQYQNGGTAGLAGGGGATGWDGQTRQQMGTQGGGNGLIIIQYAIE